MTYRVNWCATCGGGLNYGDQLTPHLLDHYMIPYRWVRPPRANLFLAGSILSKAPDLTNATIAGTGLIRADMTKDLSRARVIALRGPLTLKRVKLPPKADPILADPGILAPKLLLDEDPQPIPNRVGVIPHYVDDNLWHIFRRYADHVLLPITTPVLELTAAIAQCELIITSSLHALITADALRIPHIYAPHKNVIGDGFKFDDYAQSMGTTIREGVKHLTPDKTIIPRISELHSAIDHL